MGGVTVEKDIFGKTADGQNVDRYTFRNGNNVTVQVIRYGGIITSVSAPDRDGSVSDICLGFDSVKEYEANNPYFGAIIGRVANRIAKGKFTLDGVEYQLPINNGPNSLHGGIHGFDKKLWDATLDESRLILQYVSEDGEEGYPGKVTAQVSYELTDENELYIDYTASTNKATPIMLTNHAYFNLAGQGSPNVYDHTVQLAADEYLPVDDTNIPTGAIAPVDGTGFDLRRTVKLGERMKAVNDGKGFDNCFCTGVTGKRKFVARVEHPTSGRYLEVYSTEPAVQFYNAYYLDDVKGKGGATYGSQSAFCLETQHYVDSVNQPSFPSIILKPGETYRHRTWYKFGVVL